MIKPIKSLVPESLKDRLRPRWMKLQHFLKPPPIPKNSDGKVYIHLGCGKVDHPKFINVDAIPFPHVHYVQAVERLDVFSDNFADLIYTSHCLEHVSHLDVPNVLKEWRRVLKPGGILRVSVPDFEKNLAIYLDNNRSMKSIELTLMGGQDYAFNFHKISFNQGYLTSLFEEAGFRNVRPWRPGSSELTTFKDWSNEQVKMNGKTYPISLNLEAEK
jgi:predicted SAM-dependent methyltransferase